MGKRRCALLDTDFISKLYITRKDEENRLIDRILELPDYDFVCHEQIEVELGRYDAAIVAWLYEKLENGRIQKFSDADLVSILQLLYGKNAVKMLLFYLNNACDLFDRNLYEQFYASLEKNPDITDDKFLVEIARCDTAVGCDGNLGEIKSYLLQQVLQNRKEIQLYIFCSDDSKARNGLANAGGIPCISALSSFYILKEKLGMEWEEAKLFFDSWMAFNRARGQTSFKVHRDTKEMQLVKMDGYEILNRIYDGTMTILKNGNLKIRSSANDSFRIPWTKTAAQSSSAGSIGITGPWNNT